MKSFKVLSVLLLLSIMTEIISEKIKCDIKLGCLMRVKYFSHVSVQTKTGKAAPLKSSLNYKIIYVYKDRLVFYSSRRATDLSLEFENEKTKLVDEMNIERIINFSNIILDCGKYHNRVCLAQNYPEIAGVPFFKNLKEIITTSPEIKCIVIPFFENSYKFSHEKLAFICIHEIRQLKQLIDFKNILSRAIEDNQMKLADDRFNSFDGLKRDQEKFILFKDNKAKQVIGRLFGKKISLVTNDKSTDHVMDYSLYQVRIKGVYFGNEALKKNLIKPDWNRNFEWKTHPECCLVFPGEKDPLYLCAASKDGKLLEKSTQICRLKLLPFLKSTKTQIRSLNIVESSFLLLSDKAKFQNCQSREYDIFRKRVDNVLSKSAIMECKLVMNYELSPFKDKFSYCIQHLRNEMKFELSLLSGGNISLNNKLSDCFYNEKLFKTKLSTIYLRKILGLKIKKSSFIEIDEIDNEDDEEVKYTKKSNNEENNDEFKKLTFAEVDSNKLSKNKPDNDEMKNDIKKLSSNEKKKKNFKRRLFLMKKKKIANGKSKLNEENRKNSNKISKKNIKKSLKKQNSDKKSRKNSTEKSNKKSFKESGKKSKMKEIERLMNKRKKNRKGDKLRKKKLHYSKKREKYKRNRKMKNSLSEGMKGKFSKLVATRGKKNVDPFIAYLGYLSDSSSNGNVNVSNKQMTKYYG